MDTWYRRAARAVRGFDDSIGTILTTLGTRGSDTIVFYINDNGFLFGEHRRVAKMVPYEESTHVPFVVRYSRLVSTGFRSPAIVMNVDIPATIMDLLGFPWGADGRSLVPLLTGQGGNIRSAALLVWCKGVHTCPGNKLSNAFVIPEKSIPSYWAMATNRFKYVEYRTGERELYDLSSDPFELANLAGTPEVSDLQTQLSQQLAALHAPVLPETTLVSGPTGTIPPSSVTFRYFSQSRLATYRCRITKDGVVGAWTTCNGERFTIGPLTPGDYVFIVVATDERGVTDPTPASRPFTVA
jgi:arylsulfatase A-like enzyme